MTVVRRGLVGCRMCTVSVAQSAFVRFAHAFRASVSVVQSAPPRFVRRLDALPYSALRQSRSPVFFLAAPVVERPHPNIVRPSAIRPIPPARNRVTKGLRNSSPLNLAYSEISRSPLTPRCWAASRRCGSRSDKAECSARRFHRERLRWLRCTCRLCRLPRHGRSLRRSRRRRRMSPRRCSRCRRRRRRLPQP